MCNNYTFREVVEAFGMKEETIFKWIEEGRFCGIQYIENKWIFDIDSKWISMPGKQVSIKEIVEAHNKLNNEIQEMSNNTYGNLMWSIIYNLQDKYGGTYEETLKKKINKSWQEKEDEKMWISYLDKVNILENIEKYKNEPDFLNQI